MSNRASKMGRIRIEISAILALGCLLCVSLGNSRNLSTKELLECRANLSRAVRNDTIFLERIHQADYIFTGKIKDLQEGRLHVRVKRAIKGLLNGTLDLILNDTCAVYIRRSYTGIFMARRDFGFGNLKHLGKVVMHFGPVPLTLANLDRLNSAVRD
ncbi:uncharacterized protein LOC112494576 isoform X2 [Cephus cinctus]|uniref:Uncharacterized protein LOC112494576 isoform X2 n=1 Tax=Cephus cinctus TaxID=211228 RepID=A0AAJ7W2Q9_CEPCN|nr:uncharacterized protein LOC112494576 isoform X2 [Cephus cinctus]